jgi:hypothetical protein
MGWRTGRPERLLENLQGASISNLDNITTGVDLFHSIAVATAVRSIQTAGYGSSLPGRRTSVDAAPVSGLDFWFLEGYIRFGVDGQVESGFFHAARGHSKIRRVKCFCFSSFHLARMFAGPTGRRTDHPHREVPATRSQDHDGGSSWLEESTKIASLPSVLYRI